MTLSEGFFSFLECLRTSLQNRCVILEHAIFVEALTEMSLCISIPLFLMHLQ